MRDISPVRILKNPDGSLAQAAMMQSALTKERREEKMLQRDAKADSQSTGGKKNWIDPLPEETKDGPGRSVGLQSQELPEWKKHVIGNNIFPFLIFL